jgi:hypothetical protein
LIAAPSFYAWSALLVTGIVAWGIQSPRVQLPGKTAAALAIALIPHTGEVFITVCNLQWILAVGLFALALATDPATWLQRICEIFSLVILGLTGPFIAPALPLFVWRACHRRSVWSWGLLALAAGCLMAQASAMLAYRPNPVPAAWAPLHGAAVVGRRLIVSLVADGFNPGEAVCIILFFIVPVIMIRILWRERAGLPGGWLLVMTGLLTLAAIAYKARLDTWHFNDLLDGDRYFFTLKILLVWLTAAIASRRAITTQRLLMVVALASFAFSLPHFIFAPYPDLHWKQYSKRMESGLQTRVPILPQGFSLTYPGGYPPN